MADSVLSHEYASPYYDPAKAHEYYLKNRELKGKRNVSELNKKDKKVWADVKSNITAEKKTATKDAATKHAVEMQQLRISAQKRKEEIQQKIKSVLENAIAQQNQSTEALAAERDNRLKDIQAKAAAKIEKAKKDSQTKIDSLPPLSNNATRAEISARRRLIASINKELTSQVSTINKETNKDVASVVASTRTPNNVSAVSKQLSDERQQNFKQISDELKKALDSAKTNYEGLKKGLANKYEAIYQKEFDAIKGP